MLTLSKPRDERMAAMPRFVALMDAARAAAAEYHSTAGIFFLSAVCRDERSLAADLLARLGVTRAMMRSLGNPAVLVARLGADVDNGPTLDDVLARAERIAREWHMARVDSGHALIALFQLATPTLRRFLGREISAGGAAAALGSFAQAGAA